MVVFGRLSWLYSELLRGRPARLSINTRADGMSVHVKVSPLANPLADNSATLMMVGSLMQLCGAGTYVVLDHGHQTSSGESHVSISFRVLASSAGGQAAPSQTDMQTLTLLEFVPSTLPAIAEDIATRPATAIAPLCPGPSTQQCAPTDQEGVPVPEPAPVDAAAEFAASGRPVLAEPAPVIAAEPAQGIHDGIDSCAGIGVLLPGAKVRLHSLQRRADLNEEAGCVGQYSWSDCRRIVVVKGLKAPMRVKKTNLRQHATHPGVAG